VRGTRGLIRLVVHHLARRPIQTEPANHQSTFDYPRPSPTPSTNVGKPRFGVSTYKPTAHPSIYLSISTAEPNFTRRSFEPVGRGAGFSRFLLLAVGAGESRPADGPCPNRTTLLTRLRFPTCRQTQVSSTKCNELLTPSSAPSSTAKKVSPTSESI
jgi:hypothetical protein